MNRARWVMAHEMQLDRDRWYMRQWAKFVGTDMDELLPEEERKEGVDLFGEAPRVFPLLGIVNPETFQHFVSQEGGTPDEIDISEYEKQAAALEKGGMLTEIDIMSTAADEAVRAAKRKKVEEILDAQDDQFAGKR